MASRYIEDDEGNMIPNPDYVDSETDPGDQQALNQQAAGWLPLQGWTGNQVNWKHMQGGGGIQHADEKAYLDWLYGPGGTYDYSGEQAYYRPAGGMGSFLPGRSPLVNNAPDDPLGTLVKNTLIGAMAGTAFSEFLPMLSEAFVGADSAINAGGLDGALGDAGSSWGNLFGAGGSGAPFVAEVDPAAWAAEDMAAANPSGGNLFSSTPTPPTSNPFAPPEQMINEIPAPGAGGTITPPNSIADAMGTSIPGASTAGSSGAVVPGSTGSGGFDLQGLLNSIFGTGAGQVAGAVGSAAGQAGSASIAESLMNYFLQQHSADNLEDAAGQAASMSNPLNDPKRQPYQQMFMELMSNPTSFYETNPVVKAQLDLAKNQFLANSAKMGVGGKQFNDYLTNVQNVAAGSFKDQANILSGAGGFGFPGGNNSQAYMQGTQAANTAQQNSYQFLPDLAGKVFGSDIFKNATKDIFSLG